VPGTTRKGALALGVLDATAKRGPRISGVRRMSCEGGNFPCPSDMITTEPVDIDQDTVMGVFLGKPVPVTTTIVPGEPTPGFRISVGLAAAL
jgi:hypothetical protein